MSKISIYQKIVVFIPWLALFGVSVIPGFVFGGVVNVGGTNEILKINIARELGL